MRKIAMVLVACFGLAACDDHTEVQTKEKEPSYEITTEFTLVKRCADGKELYRLTEGNSLVQWNSTGDDKGYFVKYEGTADDYCIVSP